MTHLILFNSIFKLQPIEPFHCLAFAHQHDSWGDGNVTSWESEDHGKCITPMSESSFMAWPPPAFMLAAHLLPPLLRRALQLSGLVIFGIEQVDVIGGVADQHLLTVLAVAERGHATRLVGQVSGNKPHAHARRPPAHVVTCGRKKKKRENRRMADGWVSRKYSAGLLLYGLLSEERLQII